MHEPVIDHLSSLKHRFHKMYTKKHTFAHDKKKSRRTPLLEIGYIIFRLLAKYLELDWKGFKNTKKPKNKINNGEVMMEYRLVCVTESCSGGTEDEVYCRTLLDRQGEQACQFAAVRRVCCRTCAGRGRDNQQAVRKWIYGNILFS